MCRTAHAESAQPDSCGSDGGDGGGGGSGSGAGIGGGIGHHHGLAHVDDGDSKEALELEVERLELDNKELLDMLEQKSAESCSEYFRWQREFDRLRALGS